MLRTDVPLRSQPLKSDLRTKLVDSQSEISKMKKKWISLLHCKLADLEDRDGVKCRLNLDFFDPTPANVTLVTRCLDELRREVPVLPWIECLPVSLRRAAPLKPYLDAWIAEVDRGL